MKLHEFKEDFSVLIESISNRYGIRADILEKDYYVTLLLEELSKEQDQLYAYFKGGTAIYKALSSIKRFSEDIDLTVSTEGCPTKSQEQKRLECATLKYKSLTKGDTLENKRGTITCEYLYDSIFSIDSDDALQRFGKIKIESTNFTISEPTEDLTIAPHLYELSDEQYQKLLRENYDVKPFIIKTISLERIFIDKIFAAEFYFERNVLMDVAKHVYDLAVLIENDKIIRFLSNKQEVERIIALKRKEEEIRKGGVSVDKNITDFTYFDNLAGNMDFRSKFEAMQKIYVFRKEDYIGVDKVLRSLEKIREML